MLPSALAHTREKMIFHVEMVSYMPTMFRFHALLMFILVQVIPFFIILRIVLKIDREELISFS